MSAARDRAAIAIWTIRRISPDVSDRQAEEIEEFLRGEFREERTDGFAKIGRAAERLVEKLSQRFLK